MPLAKEEDYPTSQPNTQALDVLLDETHQTSETPLKPQPKSLLWWYGIIGIATLISLLIFFGFLHKSKRIPSVQAQEYIENAVADFESLRSKLRYYQGGFVKVSSSLSSSKEAFYEILTSRDYSSAVEDTKKDIQDIQETLQRIAQSVDEKKQTPAPPEFKKLDELLDTYYRHAESGMRELLVFEEFQLSMLNASGDDLNHALKDFDRLMNKTLKNNGDISQEDFLTLESLIEKIARLGDEAYQRFEEITPIPHDHKTYYSLQKEYHKDLAQTFRKTFEVLKNNSSDNPAQLAADQLSEFLKRNNDRTKTRELDTKEWMEKTPIKKDFSAMADAENKISELIDTFLQTYTIPTPILPSISPGDNASPSATTTVQPSISQSVSVTPSPSGAVSPIPEEVTPALSPILETTPSSIVTP